MTAIASSFARANLIGEHTDYNHGFVLPTPLPYEITVQIEKIEASKKSIFLISESLNESREVAPGSSPQNDWTDYAMGALHVLGERGIAVPPIRIRISSTIPMGAGLSSSAALLVATLRALRGLIGFAANDRELALMAHEAERNFVGIPCGIMDQFVCALGRPNHAFMLDTKHLTYEQVRMPTDRTIMLVHCGKTHRLASNDGYRQRVAECKQACSELGVESLRDLSIKDIGKIEALTDISRRRARHVITENQRVLDAVEALRIGNDSRFEELMAASHDSQRDDYEVSIPEINALVESSRRYGLRGARLTGGGFGGSIVGFIPKTQTGEWWEALKRDNPECQLISTYGLSSDIVAA